MENFKKIICPLDFSSSSAMALRAATDWGRKFGSEVLVLHVLPPLVTAPDFAALTIPDMLPTDDERKAEALDDLLEIVAESTPTDVPVRCEVRLGDAAEEIVAAAREGGDLIVIPTHGHTGWRHLLFGSIAECVVRTAPCPVLTIHAAPAPGKIGDSAIEHKGCWRDAENVCVGAGQSSGVSAG